MIDAGDGMAPDEGRGLRQLRKKVSTGSRDGFVERLHGSPLGGLGQAGTGKQIGVENDLGVGRQLFGLCRDFGGEIA